MIKLTHKEKEKIISNLQNQYTPVYNALSALISATEGIDTPRIKAAHDKGMAAMKEANAIGLKNPMPCYYNKQKEGK